MIRLEALGKRFSPGPQALQGIDLDIDSNAWVLISGGSGCGKTTLLHLIMGLEQPTEGKVFLQHQHLGRLNAQVRARLRANIGLIFQEPHLLQRRSLIENVALPLELAGQFGRTVHQRALQSLDLLGLSARASALPSQVSSSERQLACIARALITRPSLIVADEPLARLDSQNAARVSGLLRSRHSAGGLTIVQTCAEDCLTLPEATARYTLSNGRLAPSQPSAS